MLVSFAFIGTVSAQYSEVQDLVYGDQVSDKELEHLAEQVQKYSYVSYNLGIATGVNGPLEKDPGEFILGFYGKVFKLAAFASITTFSTFIMSEMAPSLRYEILKAVPDNMKQLDRKSTR